MAKQRTLQTLAVLYAALVAAIIAVPVHACTLRSGDNIPTLITPLGDSEGRRAYAYHADLLQLVLDKTAAEFGPCKLKLLKTNKPINRIYLNISDGREFDTVESTATPARDKKLLPVRFPVFRGLMGYRVMVIREGDQPLFDGINTIPDLQRITFGASINWFDRKLVRQHKIPTVDGDDLFALYRMLPARRFDAILRGTQEVIIDELRVGKIPHDIEKNLVVAYPLPVNFYVKKSQVNLAARLKAGLEKAQADGSFQEFFTKQPLIKKSLERIQLDKRHFIYMCNPTLSTEITIDNPNYWYKPWPKNIVECSRPKQKQVQLIQ